MGVVVMIVGIVIFVALFVDVTKYSKIPLLLILELIRTFLNVCLPFTFSPCNFNPDFHALVILFL